MGSSAVAALRFRLLLASCLHAAGARRPPPAGAVAQKHISEGALNAYAIGEGFEGSASDWTEYVVWTVGVAALIFYLSGVVKIDVYNIDDKPIKREPEHIEVRVLENFDDTAKKEFLTGAKIAYENIITSFSSGNLKNIKSLLDKKVLN